jgi:toxin ParE1/3/4
LKLLYSAQARKDLANIKQWTLGKFGPVQADAYLLQIHQNLTHLTDNPVMALDASDLRAELFRRVVGQHVTFLWLTPNSVKVVRILHGSMDFDRWL